MKRILSLVLAFVLVLGLCACNKNTDEPITTEPVISHPTETPDTTEPSVESPEDDPTLNEAKEAALKEALLNKQYVLNATAIRASLIHDSYDAQLSAIQGENGKMLYSVSGFVDGVMTDYDLCQDDQGNIFFHEKITDTTIVENWYRCTDIDDFDITQNLFDMTFFDTALKQVSDVEYIEEKNGYEHYIIHSTSTANQTDTTNTQIVFDLFIDKAYYIDSIRYYVDDIEWLIVFVSPEQAKLHIPEGATIQEIAVCEAQQLMDKAHAAVQTPPPVEEEHANEEHAHEEHVHEEHESGALEQKAADYKEILKNREYVISWDNMKINFNNLLTLEAYSGSNNDFVHKINAPIDNPTHISILKRVDNITYYGETTNAKDYTWTKLDTTGIEEDIKNWGYLSLMQYVFPANLEQVIDIMTSLECLGSRDGEDVLQVRADDGNITMLLHIQPDTKKITYVSFQTGSVIYEITLLDAPDYTFKAENTSKNATADDGIGMQFDFITLIAQIIGVTEDDLFTVVCGESV